jgi:hypothetical protein
MLFLRFFRQLFAKKERNDDEFLESIDAAFSGNRIDIPIETFTLKPYKPKPCKEVCTALQPGKLSKGEKICLDTLESYYQKKFYRVRPSFLRNPETGKNLEIDCFNAELGIGVEYNGKQHYHYPSFPGDTKEKFVKRIKRDLLKLKVCKSLNVYIIVVPYNISERDIPEFIISRLPK